MLFKAQNKTCDFLLVLQFFLSQDKSFVLLLLIPKYYFEFRSCAINHASLQHA